MDRNEITKFLGKLLENNRLSGMGKHYAKEVTLDYGTIHPKRIDYLQFAPENGLYVDGIEKGVFTCYEIKSCKEDVYSGHGINFYGEKNYLVMTMDTYKDILPDINDGTLAKFIKNTFPESSDYWGIMVAVPDARTQFGEFNEPTQITENVSWKLEIILPCRRGPRKRSIVELLFCMIRSGK